MKDINDEVSMITNLNNIKQGLKQDYSDKEILDMLLVNTSMTDTLIGEHLRWGANTQQPDDTKYVSRDPASYRDFVKNTYFSKDQEDPFTHFYIKESGKYERIHQVYNDAKDKYENYMKETTSLKASERTGKILKSLGDKVDEMLI